MTPAQEGVRPSESGYSAMVFTQKETGSVGRADGRIDGRKDTYRHVGRRGSQGGDHGRQ